jgi:hypothetical protein
MIFLIATLTSIVVGNVEISPGVCQVDYLVDSTFIQTQVQSCSPITQS